MRSQRQSWIARIAAVVCVGIVLSACGSHRSGPYSGDGAVRDTVAADGSYTKAMAVIASDPAEAESMLRETLSHDLYHGRAHNNLGVLLFRSGKLYEAAGEFEWARRLMPGLPEPRVNLALVLDQGGRAHEALEAALTALEVQPNDLAALQAIVMIQLREGTADATTLERLQQIADRADDTTWVAWAKNEKSRLQGKLDAQQP